MVNTVDCDIFDAPINVLLQGNNCWCVQQSGLAGQLRKHYPEAYEADCETEPGARGKLGSFTLAEIKNQDNRRSKTLKYIFNCYTQYNFGTHERQVDYEAIYLAFQRVKEEIMTWDRDEKIVVGIPYKIGCGLAGGDFRIIDVMIKCVFENADFDVLICRRPGD